MDTELAKLILDAFEQPNPSPHGVCEKRESNEGVSDPVLVFGFHSSHVVMCVLVHKRSKDLTLADKELMKTPLDLQNVSRYTMRVPNTWRPIVAARHSQRTAQHSARISDRSEKHWLTGNVGLSTAY